MDVTKAHDQTTSHKYTMHYPEHPPRPEDPHYVDFEHYRKTHKDTAKCKFADSATASQCTSQLELHHAFVEFSLQQGVDFAVLEKDFPGISDPTKVGAWVESDQNFEWLCSFHHRGHGGAHVAAHADFIAERYVRDLIS
jgi:hypothetical protein